MHRNADIPEIFAIYTLGSVIALCLGFFITVFSKLSLHAVGVGGLSGILLVMLWHFGYQGLNVLGFNLHIKLVFMLSLIVSGLVGSARLWLNAHTTKDVFGGFLVGIASQFIALQILL
jgi:membrane-associated phospholipid phosphatase